MGTDIKDFLTENGVKWSEVYDLKARDSQMPPPS